MSNAVAIGLIFGLFSVAFAINTLILRNIEDWSERIVTGVSGGVVLPLRYRKVLLIH